MRRSSPKAWPRGPSVRRLKAMADATADEARKRADVKAARAKYVPDGLLEWIDLRDWIEARSSEGDPVEFVTRDNHDRIVRRERPVVCFCVPGERSVRAVRTTEFLEELRWLSLSLERLYGWRSAAAVVFVLSDRVPVESPRFNERTRADGTVEVGVTGIDRLADPEGIAEILRANRPSATELKYTALLEHAAEFGTGTKSHVVWNSRHLKSGTGWEYSETSSFDRAIRQARSKPQDRLGSDFFD